MATSAFPSFERGASCQRCWAPADPAVARRLATRQEAAKARQRSLAGVARWRRTGVVAGWRRAGVVAGWRRAGVVARRRRSAVDNKVMPIIPILFIPILSLWRSSALP